MGYAPNVILNDDRFRIISNVIRGFLIQNIEE